MLSRCERCHGPTCTGACCSCLRQAQAAHVQGPAHARGRGRRHGVRAHLESQAASLINGARNAPLCARQRERGLHGITGVLESRPATVNVASCSLQCCSAVDLLTRLLAHHRASVHLPRVLDLTRCVLRSWTRCSRRSPLRSALMRWCCGRHLPSTRLLCARLAARHRCAS